MLNVKAELPQPGDIFRHYKNNDYQIITLAVDCDTGLETVVYKAVATGKVWVRPLIKFMSMVQDCENPTPVRRYVLIERNGSRVPPGRVE